MGGYNGKVALHSAECYNPFLNEWTSIASMSEATLSTDATAGNGFIYVLNNKLHDAIKVERYEVKTNTWTMVTPLYNLW